MERKPTKRKTKKSRSKEKTMYDEVVAVRDDLFERCLKEGLIEKTNYGYYFTPEFFKTLEIYNDDD